VYIGTKEGPSKVLPEPSLESVVSNF